MMEMFAILCVSVVCLMGGMAMPTDLDRGAVTTVTSGQSEESCVWRSDIPVHNMTDLLDKLNAVKIGAENAFNTTCRALIAEPEVKCPILKDQASQADGYPRFNPRVTNSCDVQEVIREAYRVINNNCQMIRQLSDNVTLPNLEHLRKRLDSAASHLGRMMGDSMLPSAVATIATEGDDTEIKEQNVRIPVYVAEEVDKIISAIQLIKNDIQN